MSEYFNAAEVSAHIRRVGAPGALAAHLVDKHDTPVDLANRLAVTGLLFMHAGAHESPRPKRGVNANRD